MKHYKSERHIALDSRYPRCGGDCSQGRRDCKTSCEPPITWSDLGLAVGIVAACFVFVFLGPWVQGWI